ncbi:MAG: MFS transporter [Proteobacteria bacterium]|nr:MFS transporter [Pseudomonadota bacterium]
MSEHQPEQHDIIAASELWTLRLGLLITPHFFGSFSQAAIASMAPVIKTALHLSYTEIGLMMATYTAVQATLGIPAAFCTDRLGFGFSIFFGFLLLGSGSLLFSHADGLTLCLIASGLMGSGYAFMNPSTAKAVFNWFPRNRRGIAASLKQTGVPIAWMIGALTLPLSEAVEWRWIMIGIAVTSAGTGLIYIPMIKKPEPPAADQSKIVPLADIWGIIKNKSLSALEVSGFFYHAGQQNLYSFITLYMTEGLRASSTMAAVALQLVQSGSILGRICIGAASDFLFKGRRKGVLVIAACVSAVGCFGLVFLQPGWGIYGALGLAPVLGFFLASASPLYQTAVREAVEPRLSGTAVGYHATLQPAGKAVGTVCFGALVDAFGFDSAWFATAVLIVIGAIVLIKFFHEKNSTAAASPEPSSKPSSDACDDDAAVHNPK